MQNRAAILRPMPETPPTADDVRWVGAQLKDGYLAMGLSRAAAAKAAGVNDRVWGRTEHGANDSGTPYMPTPASVVKMAKGVRVDPKPLLARLGYSPGLADVIGAAVPANEDRLQRVVDEVAGLKRLFVAVAVHLKIDPEPYLRGGEEADSPGTGEP